MGPFWIANLVVLGVSLVIFLTLTAIYSKSMIRNKAKAFMGLLVVMILFSIQAVVSLSVYLTLSTIYGEDLAIMLLVINVLGLSTYLVLYRTLSV